MDEDDNEEFISADSFLIESVDEKSSIRLVYENTRRVVAANHGSEVLNCCICL